VRRVTKALQKAGYAIGQKKVRRLLKQWGLSWQPLRKRKPQTTVRDPQAVGGRRRQQVGSGKRQGQLGEPNRGWVGDVVYVSTRQESDYLATLLDVYSRKVVGWPLSPINDTALRLKALQMAIANWKPGSGLIHHTDHGTNYTPVDNIERSWPRSERWFRIVGQLDLKKTGWLKVLRKPLVTKNAI